MVDSKKKFCEPEYCVFPSYGHRKETQQEGTTTNVGIECNGVDDARKEGDFWFVPKDAKCEFTCKADNGKAYRNGVLSVFFHSFSKQTVSLTELGQTYSDHFSAPSTCLLIKGGVMRST